MKTRSVILLVTVLAALSGCNEPFSPRTEYEKKMVVYCVLTNQSDTQYVRVYTTYEPESFDPLSHTDDTPVRDAVVSVVGGAQAISFHDTLLQRTDTSRYHEPVRAYVAYGFTPVPRTAYSITVASPTHGTVTAIVTVPGTGYVDISNQYVLTKPGDYLSSTINLFASMHLATKGEMVRMFVEGTYGSPAVPFQVEIPRSVVITVNANGNEIETPVYSQLEPAGHLRSFSVRAYVYGLQQVRALSGGVPITFKQVRLVYVQAEGNLYTYFSIANGFQDKYSIRTDQPDFTNISGGLGIFGAMWTDVRIVPLPAKITF